jgi:hypothetical protein
MSGRCVDADLSPRTVALDEAERWRRDKWHTDCCLKVCRMIGERRVTTLIHGCRSFGLCATTNTVYIKQFGCVTKNAFLPATRETVVGSFAGGNINRHAS